MDHSISSRATIRTKARRAFASGKGRDEHGMSAGSAAVETWQTEWDLCAQAARAAAKAAHQQQFGSRP